MKKLSIKGIWSRFHYETMNSIVARGLRPIALGSYERVCRVIVEMV
jgi:hypothetical protein